MAVGWLAKALCVCHCVHCRTYCLCATVWQRIRIAHNETDDCGDRWHAVQRNRRLVKYHLQLKDLFHGCTRLSIALDASRVGRRELLLIALMHNVKGVAAWGPVQAATPLSLGGSIQTKRMYRIRFRGLRSAQV